MRRTIGKRLTESKQTLPHYYLTVEVNMGMFLISHVCGSGEARQMDRAGYKPAIEALLLLAMFSCFVLDLEDREGD